MIVLLVLGEQCQIRCWLSIDNKRLRVKFIEKETLVIVAPTMKIGAHV